MSTGLHLQNGRQFVTMQSVHLNLLSVAGLGDFISGDHFENGDR
jgi:hypothetical protein